MRLILRLILNAVVIYAVAWLLPGMSVRGVEGALITAIAFGLMNFFVRPILFFFTLPLTIVTLGLFSLVVNGITLGLTAWLIDSLRIDGLGTAIIAALLIAVGNWLVNIGERD